MSICAQGCGVFPLGSSLLTQTSCFPNFHARKSRAIKEQNPLEKEEKIFLVALRSIVVSIAKLQSRQDFTVLFYNHCPENHYESKPIQARESDITTGYQQQCSDNLYQRYATSIYIVTQQILKEISHGIKGGFLAAHEFKIGKGNRFIMGNAISICTL